MGKLNSKTKNHTHNQPTPSPAEEESLEGRKRKRNTHQKQISIIHEIPQKQSKREKNKATALSGDQQNGAFDNEK